MQAVVLTGAGVSFRQDRPDGRPAVGEVPVRVIQAGICETDLQLIQGYMGFTGVLGHEFVGIAEDGPLAGRRVVGEINCSCRKCALCRHGLSNHCPHRSVLGILNHDGAFAERVCLPRVNLHAVPDGITDDEAVFTEPLAAAFEIPAQLDVERFGTAIVLGDGRLGSLCAQVLQLHDCSVTVIGKHAEKLTLLDSMGLSTALLKEVEPERTADLVVDCTGSRSGLPTACRFVRPRGTVVLKTTTAGENGPNLAPLVIDELTIVGSRCGPFERALRALADGEVQVTPLITARFPLRDAIKALKTAQSSGQLKVLLDIGDG